MQESLTIDARRFSAACIEYHRFGTADVLQ
jgi:hypothetical protein